MVEEIDLPDWRRRRAELERRFRQDTVIIRYMPMALRIERRHHAINLNPQRSTIGRSRFLVWFVTSGKRYDYEAVPPETYAAFRNAFVKGRFLTTTFATVFGTA